MKSRPEYDAKLIGNNLRRLREAKKLSVKDVSQYLRISEAAVYSHEEGKRYPQSDTLLALMELYDAELHDLIDDQAALEISFEMDTFKVLSSEKQRRLKADGYIQFSKLLDYYWLMKKYKATRCYA